MSTKRYYWLKLMTDFFQNKHIKALQALPGGDTLIVCYIKMLLVSVSNGGYIEIEGIYDSPAREIALMIDQKDTDVEVVLRFGLQYGLINKVEEEQFHYEMVQAATLIDAESIDARRKRLKSEVKLIGEPQSDKFRMRKLRAKKWCQKHADCLVISDYDNNKDFDGTYYLVIKRDKGHCQFCDEIHQVTVIKSDIIYEDIEFNQWITICPNCLTEKSEHKQLNQSYESYENVTNSYEPLRNRYVTVTNLNKNRYVTKRNDLEEKRNGFTEQDEKMLINTDEFDSVTKAENERNKGVTFPLDIDIETNVTLPTTTTTSNNKKNEIKELIYLYKDIIKKDKQVSKIEEKIIQEAYEKYSKKWIIEALKISVKRNPDKNSWSYIEAILKNWKEKYDGINNPWTIEEEELNGINQKHNRSITRIQSNRESNRYETTTSKSSININWDREPDHL